MKWRAHWDYCEIIVAQISVLMVLDTNGVKEKLQKSRKRFLELSCVSDKGLAIIMWDTLRDLVLFAQFKKSDKNTHGGVLLLVKLEASPCELY